MNCMYTYQLSIYNNFSLEDIKHLLLLNLPFLSQRHKIYLLLNVHFESQRQYTLITVPTFGNVKQPSHNICL